MLLKPFNELPLQFQSNEVKEYYDILNSKKPSLVIKQVADFLIALILLFVLALPMIIISIVIKCTSKGPVLFKQKRVGRYLKPFYICKFRTMRVDAEKMGAQITVGERDPRITNIGWFLRKYRLDELPQIFNILLGQMSFVGARPEVPRYVDEYSGAMTATLLIKPGITGYASIHFKNENELLGKESDPEKAYILHIIPAKMKLDLEYLQDLSPITDIKTMLNTVLEVVK